MFGRLAIFAGAGTIAARVLTGNSNLTAGLAVLAFAALTLWIASRPELDS